MGIACFGVTGLLLGSDEPPKDYKSMVKVLDSIEGSLRQPPRDGKFGLSRAKLPHNRQMEPKDVYVALREIRSGKRLGIFARAKTANADSKFRGSWYAGEIPASTLTVGELENNVVLPAAIKLFRSSKKDGFVRITAKKGIVYEVATRKVFAVDSSCYTCHKNVKPREPIAVIGIARTPNPPLK